MKVLFHLGHPAHFHLFKHVIGRLREKGNEVVVVIKKKDVLEDLLKTSGIPYTNILPDGRRDGKLHVAIGQLKQDYKLLIIARKFRPDIMVGTSVAISHVGKLLGIPSVNVNEDDAEIVPLYAKLAYPWATHIVAPEVCSVGKWTSKKSAYSGYHELAYLHPNHFTPLKEIAEKYVPTESPFFILRFAKLTAHHDDGVRGISSRIASSIIEILSPHGKVFITSERQLEPEFEKYRIGIDPKDMHHVMAFASLYIGDSQTMAAEAGVLGVPFVRFNDFVGKISYLKELEDVYRLGYGILPGEEERLYSVIRELVASENNAEIFQTKRARMLSEKIDLSLYLTWFLENYPESVKKVKEQPDYQYNFR
jgi:predicted glycosyltransferase